MPNVVTTADTHADLSLSLRVTRMGDSRGREILSPPFPSNLFLQSGCNVQHLSKGRICSYLQVLVHERFLSEVLVRSEPLTVVKINFPIFHWESDFYERSLSFPVETFGQSVEAAVERREIYSISHTNRKGEKEGGRDDEQTSTEDGEVG